jgi:hypothetical protein
VTLTAPGVESQFTASYAPFDSISNLAHAAVAVLAGVPEQVVIWNTEPEEHEFRFVTREARTRLTVHKYPDHRRRRPMEVYEVEWRHPFPLALVERLSELCRDEVP